MQGSVLEKVKSGIFLQSQARLLQESSAPLLDLLPADQAAQDPIAAFSLLLHFFKGGACSALFCFFFFLFSSEEK